MVNLLLEFGANVDAKNSFSKTPLFNACCAGHVRFAEKLLDAGADVESRSELDNCATPLHGAVRNAQVAVVHMLLARGADPFAKIFLKGHEDDGFDVLRVAEILVDGARNPDGNAFFASIAVERAEEIANLLRMHVAGAATHAY
jgi:ankyrin repeat protein